MPHLDVISFSSTISTWAVKTIMWQCGLLGIRVGEATHPGPICPNCGDEMWKARLTRDAPCNWCGTAGKRRAER
eukprot:6366105-Karenia_brevis.AAC.1